MLIQVFNAGSSSIKFALYQHQSKLELLKGNLEKIGEASSILSYQTSSSPSQKIELPDGCQNHKEGIRKILEIFDQEKNNPGSADLIVHRVVHGGTKYRHAALLDLEVKQFIRDMIPLARTHHPASLACIEEITEHFPEIPQAVVFDTSFHQTLPEYAWRYALPRKISDRYAIRRYGFHGISHQSVVKQAASFLETPVNKLNLITIHLGNGASISAIKKGICVDTTMGMTPLEGLVMGTRPGDLDPGI
ncbi:MAG: acetate kinase, partial [SAR324 cluster bacterium]|nr:acetate kinase [SAR324 cluster bacterium]